MENSALKGLKLSTSSWQLVSLGPIHTFPILFIYIYVLEIKCLQSYKKSNFTIEFTANFVKICILSKTRTIHAYLCFIWHVSFILNHKHYCPGPPGEQNLFCFFLGRYFGQKFSRCPLSRDCLELLILDMWKEPFHRNLGIFVRVGVIFVKSGHKGLMNLRKTCDLFMNWGR